MISLNYKLFVIGLLSTVLLSCDVPGRLLIKNETSGTIIYRHLSTQVPLGSSDETSFIVHADSTRGILMGFGYIWDDEGINSYASNTDLIEIRYGDSTSILFDDRQEIISFLKTGKRGLLKKKLKITLKSSRPTP